MRYATLLNSHEKKPIEKKKTYGKDASQKRGKSSLIKNLGEQ